MQIKVIMGLICLNLEKKTRFGLGFQNRDFSILGLNLCFNRVEGSKFNAKQSYGINFEEKCKMTDWF